MPPLPLHRARAPLPSSPQVLANDVVEFMPYVFQIFSQLLELRPAGEFSDVSCLCVCVPLCLSGGGVCCKHEGELVLARSAGASALLIYTKYSSSVSVGDSKCILPRKYCCVCTLFCSKSQYFSYLVVYILPVFSTSYFLYETSDLFCTPCLDGFVSC